MKSLSDQTFLVTGANGFVGKATCKQLIASGNKVISVVRKQRIKIDDNDQLLIVENINSGTDWGNSLKQIDVILHLAARVHVMNDYSSDPLQEFLDVNLHGTMNLAKQAADAGVKRFVYVSSIKVNGEYTIESPFSERDLPDPQDHYAISKYQAEEALFKLSKETGMEVVIIRPPLVYGAGVKANFLNLLKNLDKLLPLPLASIDNKRSMIYVENLADALIVSATHPKAANQVYLLSDVDISTPDLIRQLARTLNKRCFIFPFPIFIMRFFASLFGKSSVIDRLTQSLVVDSSKIRNELDWQPPFTQQQGFKTTVAWYLQHKENR